MRALIIDHAITNCNEHSLHGYLSEISKAVLNLYRERIRQLKDGALEKIRLKIGERKYSYV